MATLQTRFDVQVLALYHGKFRPRHLYFWLSDIPYSDGDGSALSCLHEYDSHVGFSDDQSSCILSINEIPRTLSPILFYHSHINIDSFCNRSVNHFFYKHELHDSISTPDSICFIFVLFSIVVSISIPWQLNLFDRAFILCDKN